jgi:hypothetical protein
MTLFCERTEIFAGVLFGMAQNKPARAKAVSSTSIVLFIGGLRGWILMRPKYMPLFVDRSYFRSVEKEFFRCGNERK